jgi:hypothetical protein
MAEQQTPGTPGTGSGSLGSGESGGRSAGQGQSWGGGSSSSSFGREFSVSDQQAGGTQGSNQAKQNLADAAGRATDKVASGLDSGKQRAADELCRVADALRQTGDQLRGDDGGSAVDGYIASAANQVDRFSNYVRSTSVRDMVTNVERFARQQPTLFVGGAFMLGLIGARFLKSSSESGASRSASMAGNDNDFESRRGPQGSEFGRPGSSAGVNVI